MPENLDMRYIYLHSPVEVLVERTTRRGRDGEGSIPQEYMQSVVELHESWLKDEPNCAHVDASRPEDAVFAEVCGVVSAWATEAAAEHAKVRLSLEHSLALSISAARASELALRSVAEAVS